MSAARVYNLCERPSYIQIDHSINPHRVDTYLVKPNRGTFMVFQGESGNAIDGETHRRIRFELDEFGIRVGNGAIAVKDLRKFATKSGKKHLEIKSKRIGCLYFQVLPIENK